MMADTQEAEAASPTQGPISPVKKKLSDEAEASSEVSYGAPLKGHEAVPLGQPRMSEAGMPVKIGEVFKPKRLETPLDKLTRRTAGRRSSTRTERKRGRYVRSRPAQGKLDDIAFDATFRQAAPYQIRRRSGEVAFAIKHTGEKMMNRLFL